LIRRRSKKFIFSLSQPLYEVLMAEAERRMITIQELIRAVIVGEWILRQKGIGLPKPF